jgi:DNA-binding PadR family transcriptional regulator
VIKGYLKLLILKELEKKEASGYELIRKFEQGFQRPSPGSVYPILKELESRELIKARKDGRKRIYSLTDRGREFLREFEIKEREVILKKLELLSRFGILNSDELEEFSKFIITRKDILIQLSRLRNWYKFIESLFELAKTSKDEAEKVLEHALKEIADYMKIDKKAYGFNPGMNCRERTPS